MGPHGSAAKPAKKIEGFEPRPITHVHASYGRPPAEGESDPQLSWVSGSLMTVEPPPRRWERSSSYLGSTPSPKVGALPELSWGLVAGQLTACTFSRVQ